MLAKEVVDQFDSGVIYDDEIWGDSALQKKHNIKKYPALFVNGKIFAYPGDLGYGDEGSGRYRPFPSEDSGNRLRRDLKRAIEMELNGVQWSYDSFNTAEVATNSGS